MKIIKPQNPDNTLRAIGTVVGEGELQVPEWISVATRDGHTGVDLRKSLAAADAAGAQKSREAGLLRIAQAALAEKANKEAKAERKRKRDKYEKLRADSLAAWKAAGLDADRIWKQKLQWAGEEKVIELAVKLAAVSPFYAGSHRGFEREAGFASPLSFPRTQVAMQMAWGRLPERDSWREVAARAGVTVR